MSESAPGPTGPSEQHAQILDKAGRWDVACRYFMNPTDDPIVAQGIDEVTTIGSFWTVGRFQCEVMGTRIEGMATTGFDPKKNLYTGTWQDSSNPHFYYFEGGIDDDGKLVMEGENIDPMSGAPVIYRSIETLGETERKLELYIDYGEDNVLKILEYDYTRAAD